MQLTLSQLRKLTATLSDNDWDIAAECVVGFSLAKKSGFGVAIEDQVLLFFWEWLTHLGFTTDAQRRYLMSLASLRNAAKRLAVTPISAPLHETCTIVDSRWFVQSRDNECHDLKYLRTIEESEVPGVTLITCDLRALLSRKWYTAERMRGKHGKSAQTVNTEAASAQAQHNGTQAPGNG